jgi:hypothetical protein
MLRQSIAHQVLVEYELWKSKPWRDKQANPLVGFWVRGVEEHIGSGTTKYCFADGSKLVFTPNEPMTISL